MLNTLRTKFVPAQLVFMGSIILLLASVWGWYKLVYSSPSQVFDRMLSNALSTSGAVKTIYQVGDGQKLNQKTHIVTAPQHTIYSVAELQPGPSGGTLITTESIGTPKTDYVRYTDIKTDQKTTEGKEFNFGALLGIWGKSDDKEATSSGAVIYNQNVLGVLPTGNLTPNQRLQLLEQISNDQVYTVDFASVRKGDHSGRPTYSYDVIVKPVAYVSMLKTFARDIGIKQLESVDPNQYAGSPPLKFKFDIDIWSGTLKKITYQEAQQDAATPQKTEEFSSYGVRKKIVIPAQTIPAGELESRLQQIQ